MPSVRKPVIRLAIMPKSAFTGNQGRAIREHQPDATILASHHYVKQVKDWPGFLREFGDPEWVLDSGAYSAKNSGAPISLKDYVASVEEHLAQRTPPAEVFSLDVIGDHVASARNTAAMEAAGLDVIPTFHQGEPWQVLLDLVGSYPKVALGGVVGVPVKRRIEWVGQCFARAWPHRFHGFGMVDKATVLGFPFESTDASSWQQAPLRYGNWKAYGKLSVRGTKQDLGAEVRYYLDLQAQARAKWAASLRTIKETNHV